MKCKFDLFFKKNSGAGVLLMAALLMAIPAIQAQSLTKANTSQVFLKMSKRFYNSEQLLSATLTLKGAVPMYQDYVVFVSPKTGDAEGLKLVAVNETEYRTEGELKILIGMNKKENDNVLAVEPGEVIMAYYYTSNLKDPKATMGQQKKQPDLISDFAFIRDKKNYRESLVVNKNFALQKNEMDDNAASLLVEGQVPVQIARNQLIFYSKDDQQWKEFMQYSGCKMLGMVPAASNKSSAAYLVEVPLKEQNINDLGQLRQFMGYKQKVFCSDEEALKLVQFCALANLDGFAVSLNPRIQSFNSSGNNNSEWEKITANPPGSGETIPGSFTDNFTNIPKAWNYMAIWDRDVVPVRVAIIDYGFAPTNDYRNAATMVQCVASPISVSCSPGAALGAPTVGASLFGRRVWHGNAVEGRSGGVLNNNFGTAGTGGQVAVPMAIKMSGAETYAFNIGGAIRTAVNNGADVINISGGFPCRALTSLGDFSYCDPGTRGAICAVLFPIVQTGAIIACNALGWIPFAGPFLVAGCIATVTTVYITACIAQFALGNPGEIISSAVQFAKSRGVPVVVSAGNVITAADLSGVPAELRPFINLDPNRMTVEDWQIVPAGLPDVVCVGAANPSAPYANNQVFGRRVDVWAPEDGDYMAPDNGDIPAGPSNPIVLKRDFNGTSAAAPFITGLIADAMAVNPQLNRSTSTNVGEIVNSLRNMLSTSAWSSAELPADPTGRRRNLVNPIGFLKAVGFAPGSPIPNVSPSIYGNNWNVESTENTDDVTPTVLPYTSAGTTRSGSIISIPGSGGAAAITDVDRFHINILSTYRPASGESVLIKLRTPTGSRFGNLTVRGTGISLLRTDVVSAAEEEKVFQGPAVRSGGMTVDFSVEGATPDQDNIYLLKIGNAVTPVATTEAAVNLTDITTELCPTTLERGDREFGGGPLINITARLQVSADGSAIDAIINYRAEETGGDRSTATGTFTQRVFTASAGTRIISVTAATASSTVLNFRGGGAGAEFGICNEGVVQDAPVTGGLIRRIVVVGDTGGNDISAGGGCRCDTKIKSITFNPVRITTEPR
jgi:Subtilase family